MKDFPYVKNYKHCDKGRLNLHMKTLTKS